MRNALIVAVLVLVLFGVWLLLVGRSYRAIEPGGQTLAVVMSKHPDPKMRRVFDYGGKEYLALFGRAEPFPRFPSGCPVYIFDRSGRLVDWTTDAGDDEAFKRRWPGYSRGRDVTQDEVQRWASGMQ